MTRQWHLREYKEGDERDILDLYKLVFGVEMSLEHWLWKYKRNPAGQPFIILAEAEQGIVGHFALLPRLMKVGDNASLGSLSVDTMVHPEYRCQGMHVIMGRETCELAARRGSVIAYGFSNQLSHRNATTKIGFTSSYGGGIPLWIKPLDFETVLRKHFTNNTLLAKLGSKTAQLGMKLFYRSSKTRPTCSIKELSSFDERFDSLWDKFSKSYDIMVTRNRAYLTWRYLEKPSDEYRIFVAERGEKLVGAIVVKCAEQVDFMIGFIMDMLSTPEEPEAGKELISAAVDHFAARQIDMAGCLMLPGAAYSRNLKGMGFVKAPKSLLPQEMYLDVNNLVPQYQKASFVNPKNWFVTWGDHDVV
ncbi:GNAT family N-acetyltransferase [Chloroflexota bacterium]